jgi:hypothetical protein
LLNYQLLWLLDTENPLDVAPTVSSFEQEINKTGTTTIIFFHFTFYTILK